MMNSEKKRRCFALSERFGTSPLANVTNVTVRERCYNVSKCTDVRRETAPLKVLRIDYCDERLVY